MFRKISSGLYSGALNPNLDNYKVSASLGTLFAISAFLAKAHSDGLLTSLLATSATLSFGWATNQLVNGTAKNSPNFFQLAAEKEAEENTESHHYTLS